MSGHRLTAKAPAFQAGSKGSNPFARKCLNVQKTM